MPKVMKIPDELVELIDKVISEAGKNGYKITMTEAMRIIAKGYKSK